MTVEVEEDAPEAPSTVEEFQQQVIAIKEDTIVGKLKQA